MVPALPYVKSLNFFINIFILFYMRLATSHAGSIYREQRKFPVLAVKELPFFKAGEGLTWVFALYNYRQNSITLQI